MGESRYEKRKSLLKNFLFMRCLAESNRSTRFCRPLPNRSVKTPCVEQSFLICECKGTTFYWFYQIFMQLFLLKQSLSLYLAHNERVLKCFDFCLVSSLHDSKSSFSSSFMRTALVLSAEQPLSFYSFGISQRMGNLNIDSFYTLVLV